MDLVIMLAEKNLQTMKRMLPYCKKNISCSRIIIVASSKLKPEIEKIPGVVFFDEDEVFPGLSFDKVADVIEKITGTRQRAGWYMQQFLKFSWAYQCKDSSYIVMDSDTFPLNEISFSKDGKYLFTGKNITRQYHEPYFNIINKIFDGTVRRVNLDVSDLPGLGDIEESSSWQILKSLFHFPEKSESRGVSFIAEHMIFDCDIVKEIVTKIQDNAVTGSSWWEKILYAARPEDISFSGYSEFETYGNYFFTFYPERGRVRKLRTLRQGAYFLGKSPSPEQLSWAARGYDILSIESWGGGDVIIR